MSVLKSFTISGIATLGTCLVLFLIYTARHSYVPIGGSKGAVLDRVNIGPPTATTTMNGVASGQEPALNSATVADIVSSYKSAIENSVHIGSSSAGGISGPIQSNLRSSVSPSLAVSRLVSENKPATSDVRGNLGPASCITNETMADWLIDRWQAAKNMNGEPIPGEHWVEIDLQGVYSVDRLVIDWEVAYSNDWTVQVRATEAEPFATLCTSKEVSSSTRAGKMHIVQEVRLPTSPIRTARFVRLRIHRPATRFGSSIWRLQVWGRDVSSS